MTQLVSRRLVLAGGVAALLAGAGSVSVDAKPRPRTGLGRGPLGRAPLGR